MSEQVLENDRRVRYVVTNPAGQSVFDVDFPIEVLKDRDGNIVSVLAVYVDGDSVSNYTINYATGTVTLGAAAPLNSIVTIEGLRPARRIYGYPLRGGFSSSLLNSDMNALIEMVQELRRDVGRAMILSKADGDVSTVLPPYSEGRAIIFDDGGFAIGPDADEIAQAEGYAEIAQNASIMAEADRVATAASAAEAAADAQYIESIVGTLTLGPAQPKAQVFTSGFTPGSSTSLTISVTPIPTQEEVFDVYFYVSGATQVPAPDRYTYNSTTGVITFQDVIPSGTTKIVVKWWTSLNAGSPGDKSINWLTKMIDQAANKIAAFGADGVSILRSLITTVSGASTHEEIPSAKAVYDYAEAKFLPKVSKSSAIAWGYVDTSSGALVVKSLFGCTAVRTGSGRVTVTLSESMNGINYIVVPSAVNMGELGNAGVVSWSINSATEFLLRGANTANTARDGVFSWVVYGEKA